MGEYIIGIDLDGTNIKGAIFNSKFQTVRETSVLTKASEGPDHVLNRIKEMIEDLISQAGMIGAAAYAYEKMQEAAIAEGLKLN